MAKVRIKLFSTNAERVDELARNIIEIAKKVGVDYRGPIPLPTQRLRVPVRKSPCGQGRETYETWEMRIHKRLIEMTADERALRLIMRILTPQDVKVVMFIEE